MTTLPDSPPRRPFWRQAIPYVLSVAAIAAMLWYLHSSHLLERFDFRSMRWEYILLALITEAAAFALRGLILALFVEQADIHLKPFEWFGLSLSSNVSNLMIPISGGMVARAGYLKLRYGLPIARFSALFAASYLIIFLVSGVSGLAILTVAWINGAPLRWIVALLLAGMALGPAAVILLPMERLPLPHQGRIMLWLHAALEGWQAIRTNRPLLIKQIIIVAALQLVQAISLYSSLLALGMGVPFADMLLMGVLINLTSFVRITPGALGVRESVAALSAELVGFGAAQGLAASLLTRLVDWALSFTLGPIFMAILARHAQAATYPEAPTFSNHSSS